MYEPEISNQESVLITLCQECGAICLYNDATFDDKATIRKDCGLIMKEETGTFSEISKCNFYQNFFYLTNLDNDPNNRRFPLCYSCIDKHIAHMQRINGLFNRFQNDVEDVISIKADKSFESLNSDEIGFWENDLNEPTTLNSNIVSKSNDCSSSPLVSKYKSARTIFPNSVQFFCFHISSNGLFGTINGLRVGRLESCPVPYEEVQSGLFFICRCLHLLMRFANVPRNTVIILEKPVFEVNQKKYRLMISNSRSEIKEFNIALHSMMQTFEMVFSILSTKGVAAPHRICSNDGTIAGNKYEYNKSDEYNFTVSMRKLLVNIKATQVLMTFR